MTDPNPNHTNGTDIAAALQKAADDQGRAATECLGQTLMDLGGGLRHADAGDLARDTARYARENPLSFLTVAAALGYAATRLAPELCAALDKSAPALLPTTEKMPDREARHG